MADAVEIGTESEPLNRNVEEAEKNPNLPTPQTLSRLALWLSVIATIISILTGVLSVYKFFIEPSQQRQQRSNEYIHTFQSRQDIIDARNYIRDNSQNGKIYSARLSRDDKFKRSVEKLINFYIVGANGIVAGIYDREYLIGTLECYMYKHVRAFVYGEALEPFWKSELGNGYVDDNVIRGPLEDIYKQWASDNAIVDRCRAPWST